MLPPKSVVMFTAAALTLLALAASLLLVNDSPRHNLTTTSSEDPHDEPAITTSADAAADRKPLVLTAPANETPDSHPNRENRIEDVPPVSDDEDTDEPTTGRAPAPYGVTDGSPTPGPDTDPKTFYVSPSGDENNNGQTMESPWQDLQAAIDRIEPGQTLFLMDGAYSGQYSASPAHWIVRKSGQPNAWIRIAAAPGHKPVLHPDKGHGLEVRNANYVEVRGLTVEGQNFGGANDYGWGLLVRESHDVRFIENTISDMPVGGISAVESSRLDIVGNTTHHNSYWGPEQGSGISIWHARSHKQPAFDDGYHIRIVANTSYANENKVYSLWAPDRKIMSDGNGIIVDEGNTFDYRGRTLVANNITYNNGGRGINVTKTNHVDVAHNTTYHNGHTAKLSTPGTELSATHCRDIRFLNNLSVSRSGLSEIMIHDVEDLDVAGNVFVTETPSGKAGQNNHISTGSPGFVRASTDPELADFRLSSSSVAVGKPTVPFNAVPVDRSGSARYHTQSTAGAYEFRN